jgi:hypothetical protein
MHWWGHGGSLDVLVGVARHHLLKLLTETNRHRGVLLLALLEGNAHFCKEIVQELLPRLFPNPEAACNVARVRHGVEEVPVAEKHEPELVLLQSEVHLDED